MVRLKRTQHRVNRSPFCCGLTGSEVAVVLMTQRRGPRAYGFMHPIKSQIVAEALSITGHALAPFARDIEALGNTGDRGLLKKRKRSKGVVFKRLQTERACYGRV